MLREGVRQDTEKTPYQRNLCCVCASACVCRRMICVMRRSERTKSEKKGRGGASALNSYNQSMDNRETVNMSLKEKPGNNF